MAGPRAAGLPRVLLHVLLRRPDPAAVAHRRPDRRRRPGRARAQADPAPVRRPAAAAGRGDRHRRSAGTAVPGRADGRFRPGGPPGLPRPGAPTGRHRRDHDTAHHARPGRGGQTGRPHPDPGGGRVIGNGSPDSLALRMSSEAEVRWSRDGQRFVHGTTDATAFVRELFGQYGTEIADLEVRRASLEDTYMALVRESESVRNRTGVAG